MLTSRERVAEIAAIPDEGTDTSDIPEADGEFFEKAQLVVPGGSALARGKSEMLAIPDVSVPYARNESLTEANAVGAQPMQEHADQKRGKRFLVPLFVINEAIEKIRDRTISGCVYDPKTASLGQAVH